MQSHRLGTTYAEDHQKNWKEVWPPQYRKHYERIAEILLIAIRSLDEYKAAAGLEL